jgi:hypothetical protein
MDFSAGWRESAADQIEKRGFARAIGANDGHSLSGLHA